MPYTSSSVAPNMVTQAQVIDRDATTHGAPSIHSRHSHSSRRHHRSGRSHHGGSSYHAQNDFPIFTHTGDVEIVILANGQERRYLLHRLILAQCSGFFEASMSEEWSRSPLQQEAQPVSRPSKPDGPLSRISSEEESVFTGSTLVTSERSTVSPSSTKRRWRYELDWENKAEDEEPILVQKVGTMNSRIRSSQKLMEFIWPAAKRIYSFWR